MTLDQAEVSKKYVITKVDKRQNITRRLFDLGFCCGSVVHVCAIAPSGGAVLVGIRGSNVALRADAASIISVKEF